MNHQKGTSGEQAAMLQLRALGFAEIVKIHNAWGIGSDGTAWAKSKVQGDIRAVWPGNGRSVLVEVKAYSGERLPYSALRPHQHDALMRHVAARGLSLLVWVSEFGVLTMQYPVAGFDPGTSLDFDWARTAERELFSKIRRWEK